MDITRKISTYLKLESATVKRLVANFLLNVLPDFWIINRYARPKVAQMLGMQCGRGSVLQRHIFYGNIRNIKIGSRSVVCRGTFLDAFDKITIGDFVSVAFQVTFITSSHELGPAEQREGKMFGRPIIIEDGVWIAARAIIGPGTVIGAGSVVSSGSALMHSVPANSLVAGVPARVLRRLDARGIVADSNAPKA